MTSLAPTVGELVSGLLPWLGQASSGPHPPGRGRALSRSGAIRRPRSPSLSPFWEENPLRYLFFQKHFPSFTSNINVRPRINLDVEFMPLFQSGEYCISQAGIKRYGVSSWEFVCEFDELDLIVSFPLRKEFLYFKLLNGTLPSP